VLFHCWAAIWNFVGFAYSQKAVIIFRMGLLVVKFIEYEVRVKLREVM
jgi:hypothetical protein